jgi:hypothetical protein
MHGLKLTYQTLGHSRNEAAIDVLCAALDEADGAIRQQALTALMARTEPRAAAQVLANWAKLQPDDLPVLGQKKNWLASSIEVSLKSSGEPVLTAIAAAAKLELSSVLPQLILLAESSASRSIQQRATQAIVSMVKPLGSAARADRDQPTVRSPVLSRLADSVRRFFMHRNEAMVDAFLLVASWGDSELRNLLASSGPETDLVFRRLSQSGDPGVIELLAGFIRRRNLTDRVRETIQSRQDEPFRDALLRTIGVEPSATVLANLRDIGMPACCRGGEALIGSLPLAYLAPLVYLYVAASRDPVETLHLIVAAVQRHSGCEAAAAFALARCEVPDADFWMRAALPVADGDPLTIAADENARLLQRLIKLLNNPDPGLQRGLRRVLQPLHAEQMLPRFESLRPRSRRRLGRVVMMVDPEALGRVRDALRHPVMRHRLQAIAMADALAAVDLLSDSFERIAREDHQEARVRAAEAMSHASGEKTLHLLQEMTNLPECPVRDAAMVAIERRTSRANV